MSRLLGEIRRSNKAAAETLEKTDLRTDSDIQSLTREELHELFPGHKHFKLRRTIFDIIQKQKPVDVILRELKGFIPQESFRTALTNNGVLVDYLRILKDIKTQINNVQSFLDAHIAVLEEFSKNPPDQESASCNPVKQSYGQPDGPSQGARGTGTSDTSGQVMLHTGQTGGHPQGPQRSFADPSTSNIFSMERYNSPTNVQRRRTTLEYKMIVGGKTFDAHQQLMEKVQDQVRLIESSQDYKVTFVFCPISSRVASDVEAAMTDVRDDKPVILVLMHHTREVKYTTSMRTWPHYANVVLHVNVFYHETVRGLLRDQQNDAAVTQIQNKLLECFVPKSEDSSGNAQGGDAESGLACNTSVRGGGNNRPSEANSYSSVFNIFKRS
ncbi:uncharacterized protein LOC116066319 isoform X1 [Sander lucioperca]|uniref:uncharacterized protein LOC116066319 isoform X1 n=1 Tax=Sander lucioperca TaxID=283035 RepID=UPI00125E7B6B|nr:uncharacterized protein LOC116066319 isoform X1 [Sander lucioperca]XP_031178173.1 uncharacterized protein LOC116066319 isoform X1 [Sander lucioperca]